MSAIIRSFQPKDLAEVTEIFFESSTKKSFKHQSEKDAFWEKYLGFYLKHFPDLVLVAEDKKILGYVVAAPDSSELSLVKIQPHLAIFQEYFLEYPAHLHINCHFESRGLGIGSKLILEIEKQFKALNIKGFHIMTAPDSANQHFYKKLGLHFQVELSFEGSPILFMGKALA